jgi:hypothetical protein
MIKKKVSVKTKDADIDVKPVRGRPKTKQLVDSEQTVPSLPSSRVFSVSIESNTKCTIRVNNIVRLKLNMGDINRLEKYITEHKGMIGEEQDTNIVGFAGEWGAGLSDDDTPKSNVQGAQGPVPFSTLNEFNSTLTGRGFTGLENFIKVKSAISSPMVVEEKTNRKDLIINSGIKRTSQEPLQIFSETWPLTSPYACWYCCHTFDTTPVGIPAILTNHVFRCYGNFCSYNCSKRYLCPSKDDEDDMVSMQSSNDIFKGDDQGEKLQLLELLYHLETDADMDEPIKTAPRRLILKMFGGTKTIEEFRRSFKTNTTYHTFKMPLASMAYHMEECIDTKTDTRRKLRNMSLDVARLEQAFNDLMETNKHKKLTVQKILSRGLDVDGF